MVNSSSEEPLRRSGRIWRGTKFLIFLATIVALILEYNLTAFWLLCTTLVLGIYTSFTLRHEEHERPRQKFWFGVLGKGLVNVIFLILFLRVSMRPYNDFPTLLALGFSLLTLRNLAYLIFSISLYKENKTLPLHPIWEKATTTALNITMLLYTLGVEEVTLKVWKLQKDIHNLSNVMLVVSLLLAFFTSIGYLYFYYRDPDHRKPLSVATQLTLSRIVLSPVFIWVFFYDNDLQYHNNSLLFKTIALIMVIFFAISDGLDGHLARKMGQVSTLGKFLDPFSDKISNMSIFLCFLASDYATVWMIAIIYFREATVETLRTLGASEGIIIDARTSGKWKTGIQVGVVITILVLALADHLILLWLPQFTLWTSLWKYIPHTLMYGVTLVTLLSGIDYILGNRKIIEKYI